MDIQRTGIDEIDFDQIFKQWYGAIRNFVYYKIGDVTKAEDIAQDTFLKLWEKRDTIKTETVKSLLYTIANNLTINVIEHNNVTFKFENKYKPDTKHPSPEYDMEMKEFDQRLQQVLGQLDEKQRTVFLMNRIDEMTYNEIAQSLGLTVKAIEKRMEKALSYLRKNIAVKI
ncbi:MAG TPA: RNA polymerase sigma-70 factor [Bacteroidales bacterium]|nr:RNA polymerase sigma-70 factor [Bacteroidales bacterium]